MTGGTEWLVDAFGCPRSKLRDPALLAELGAVLVRRLELNVIGAPLVHRFDGEGGVTALYLLSESHLAFHTYPESGLCTLNLYCCKPRTMLDLEELFGRVLGAAEVRVNVVTRGARG